MTASELQALILPAWRTNARVTEELVHGLPSQIFRAAISGFPRRTVGMMAIHLHNSRCNWLRTLGGPLGLAVPPLIEGAQAGKPALVRGLRQSAAAMEALLALGCERGGQIPANPRYVWRNLALDVGHVLTYFVGHEAHHRGQLILTARQLGHPVPVEIASRLWWWKQPARRGRHTLR